VEWSGSAQQLNCNFHFGSKKTGASGKNETGAKTALNQTADSVTQVDGANCPLFWSEKASGIRDL
jgi:hypothetical protein